MYEEERSPNLPKAYGGCHCICHRVPAKHIVACCQSSDDESKAMFDLLKRPAGAKGEGTE